MEFLDREIFNSTILVVDDEYICREVTANSLAQFKNVIKLSSGQEAIEFCMKRTPALILLDVNMPELDGYLTCQILRRNENLHDCPILFHTSEDPDESEIVCWRSGGTDFIQKPARPDVLQCRVRKHLETQVRSEYMRTMYNRDLETRLYNRHFFDVKYGELAQFAIRHHLDLSILSIEINLEDDAKTSVKGRCSNYLLFELANLISKCAKRSSDFVCRYVQNKFVILLPGTALEGARVVAHSVLESLRELSRQQHYGVEYIVAACSLNHVMKSQYDLMDEVYEPGNKIAVGCL